MISPTVFEIQGSKKNAKNTPTPNLREIFPRLCCQTLSLNFLVRTNILNLFWPKSRRFATPSPWKTFLKNSFFEISQNPLEISKPRTASNLWVFSFTITYSLGAFWYLQLFLRYRGSNKIKKHPSPQIYGKYFRD